MRTKEGCKSGRSVTAKLPVGGVAAFRGAAALSGAWIGRTGRETAAFRRKRARNPASHDRNLHRARLGGGLDPQSGAAGLACLPAHGRRIPRARKSAADKRGFRATLRHFFYRLRTACGYVDKSCGSGRNKVKTQGAAEVRAFWALRPGSLKRMDPGRPLAAREVRGGRFPRPKAAQGHGHGRQRQGKGRGGATLKGAARGSAGRGRRVAGTTKPAKDDMRARPRWRGSR